MPVLRHEEAQPHKLRQNNRRRRDTLLLYCQMQWMPERCLYHHPDQRHQNRDTRMEPVRQRRMA